MSKDIFCLHNAIHCQLSKHLSAVRLENCSSIFKKNIFHIMTLNITMPCNGTDLFHVGYASELIWCIQKFFAQKFNLFMHQHITVLQYQIPWMPNICSISTKYTLIYIFLLTREKWYIWCLCFWCFCTTNQNKR